MGSNHSSACTCDRGYYESGPANCTICPANSWCWGGVKNDCPADKVSEPGLSWPDNCTCVDGSFLEATGSVYDVPYSGHTYSSTYSPSEPGELHARGRLDSSTAWISLTGNTNEWFQMDMEQPVGIAGVVTKGRSGIDRWVTSFTVQSSLNEIDWTPVDNGVLFTGNNDRDTLLLHHFLHPIHTRYIRIHPWTWYPSTASISMRAGVLLSETTQCTLCSVCPTGQYAKTVCTATTNTICSACSVCSSELLQIETSPCNATDDTVCECLAGYESVNGNSLCTDIENCGVDDNCHANATCDETAGSFTCACGSGWLGNGVNCTICPANSWCSEGNRNDCQQNSFSEPGMVAQQNCTCYPGFRFSNVDGTIADIPVAQYSFSSYYNSQQESAFNPRLDAPLSELWTPSQKDTIGEWVKIDLGYIQSIVGLGTVSYSTGNAVRSFTIETSLDDTLYTYVDGGNVFDRPPTEASVIHNSYFSSPYLAKYVKIRIITWVSWPYFGFSTILKGAACTACPVNYYCQDGAQTPCQACEDGTFVTAACNVTHDVMCDACQKDHWCAMGVTNECPLHSQSEPHAVKQQNCTCSSGYYGPAGGLCQECTVDHWCPGGGEIFKCPHNSSSLHMAANSSSDCFCDEGFEQ
eukprot:1601050-Rhodomonas_salina.1